MSRAGLWFKMFAVGTVLCIGGPALVYWVSPTEEELFKRYNPALQQKSLENRHGRQQEFDDFVCKLKEYSKSSKPIWTVRAEDDARTKAKAAEEKQRVAAEIQKRREEIKRHSMKVE
ncbi:assembly factor cbp4 [Toensbergia leucococca]|nr:assembly factor cbp4 [Toensbergia leucococca]